MESTRPTIAKRHADDFPRQARQQGTLGSRCFRYEHSSLTLTHPLLERDGGGFCRVEGDSPSKDWLSVTWKVMLRRWRELIYGFCDGLGDGHWVTF